MRAPSLAFILMSVLFHLQDSPRPGARLPATEVVPLPYFDGAHAIWGATGQDARGHIWLGVTTDGLTPNSAHLFEYAPEAGTFTDRGNVVDVLRRAGLLRAGDQQAKIHSKIVEAPDGYLYFASMDEEGEGADGSRLPTWGGHLWRMSPRTHRWEHLLATREALIAVGGAGRWIYALGYFGHVLYQYDTQTNRTARLDVGSVDGHISRNLLVDRRGHAYVPRLSAGMGGTGGDDRRVSISLVEFDTDLRERASTSIDSAHYLGSDAPTNAHGIVGLQEMADGSIFFTTHAGRLFRVTPASGPRAGAPTPESLGPRAQRAGPRAQRPAPGAQGPALAEVTDLGWLHPDGPSYPASLFTGDGKTSLRSLARRSGQPWEWVSCVLPRLQCSASVLVVPGRDQGALNGTLLYGSATRDSSGAHYVVGIGNDYRPVVLRIRP